jgi:cation/acetate symporter
MSAQVLTYLFVGLSFALYIGIAIWSRSSSTREFYVAGGHVHPLANGAATAADWMRPLICRWLALLRLRVRTVLAT